MRCVVRKSGKALPIIHTGSNVNITVAYAWLQEKYPSLYLSGLAVPLQDEIDILVITILFLIFQSAFGTGNDCAIRIHWCLTITVI